MPHILHDISVWRWAIARRHPLSRESRLLIVWPISCRRHHGFIGRAWIIELQRPSIHWLNTYRLELEYMLEHKPVAPHE